MKICASYGRGPLEITFPNQQTQAGLLLQTDGLLYGFLKPLGPEQTWHNLHAAMGKFLNHLKQHPIQSVYADANNKQCAKMLAQNGFMPHSFSMWAEYPFDSLAQNSSPITNMQISMNNALLQPLWRSLTDSNKHFDGILEAYKQRNRNFFLLNKSNLQQVIGAVSLFDVHPDYDWINGLLVHPSFRGKGLGAKLMQQVMMSSQKSAIRLGTSLGNMPFFTQMGFKKSSGLFVMRDTTHIKDK